MTENLIVFDQKKVQTHSALVQNNANSPVTGVSLVDGLLFIDIKDDCDYIVGELTDALHKSLDISNVAYLVQDNKIVIAPDNGESFEVTKDSVWIHIRKFDTSFNVIVK